jgi:prepilin-type N-terminal cleavage/methylation domain-containing protein
MKILTAISSAAARTARAGQSRHASRITHHREQGFTMIEIAICLAIIGVALVGIIGVLPYGMNTQRDNREETVIGQDANILSELIRNGSHGADDLTNYVYAIAVTNQANLNYGYFNPVVAGQVNFSSANSFPTIPANNWYPILTNGAKIIGLLSTPEFTYYNGAPVIDVADSINYYTNYVKACVRSISGLATEKPPQNNGIMVGDSFSYRMNCVNATLQRDTNNPFTGYIKQLAANQHELRITFLWPLLPNGHLGAGRQTFRTTVAGRLSTNTYTGAPFYFYQPQTFSPAP